MKKFLIRSLPYIGIGLLFAGIGEFFLLQSKESCTIDYITDIQSTTDKELYYGREILGNSLSNYKYQMFLKTQPEILVLGQSVTLQFRNFVFEPYEKSFYNTGLMARNINDLNYVLDLIESGQVKKPELILLGLDLSFVLNDSFLDATEWTRNYPKDRALSVNSHLKGIQKIYLSNKLRRKPKGNVGFGRAGMIGRGYRNDGSYRHKPELEAYLKDSTYFDGGLSAKLRNRSLPFTAPFSFSSQKATEVLKALERFDLLGVELVIYIPPYSDTFFEEAAKDEFFASYWEQYMIFQDKLIASEYNVISFCTPKQIGLTDDYMVDAEHPGEVLCAIQLRDLVRSGKATGKTLNSLSFMRVDQYLAEGNYIPMSFLRDSLSVGFVSSLKSQNN